MNKYIKFPLVLGTVALISGALLATTYQLTKEKIEQGVIDRQTNVITDLFEKIDSKTLLDVDENFSQKGVSSIIEVVSDGNVYKCYTINYKDGADGENISVIIALDSDAKVYGVKFINVDSYVSDYYNNEEYLASVVENDNFDVITDATKTANDLNKALKIAKECFAGKIVEPIDELFGGTISSKEDIALPVGVHESINSIRKSSEIKPSGFITHNCVSKARPNPYT